MIEVVVLTQGKFALGAAIQSLESQEFPDHQWKYRIAENPIGLSREDEILKSSAEWIFFLDEDCLLPDGQFLNRFESLSKTFPEVQIWGGLYLSFNQAAYSVKAYNELCNFWVLLSHQGARTRNLLGGALALHIPSVKPLIQKNPISWGGEDTYLLRVLQKAGIDSRYSKEISVYHNPPPQSLLALWNRASKHGESRKKYHLETPTYSLNGFLHAFRNIRFWPVWAFHFVSLAKGLTNLKIVQEDRSQQ